MLILVSLIILALATAYLARRALAREALVGWLQSRGVEAEARFETLGLQGLVGDLRIGPRDNPIILAERAEVDYRITGPWAGRALGVEVRRLRLIHPTVRASFGEAGFSLSALDPLIAEFRERPSVPGAAAPVILVREGVLRLSHPGGEAVITLDARMADGVLTDLSGRMAPTRFRAPNAEGLDVEITDARLGLITREGRSAASLVANLKAGRWAGYETQAGELSLAAAVPYPDKDGSPGAGPVTLAAHLRAEQLNGRGLGAENVDLQGGFRGALSGDWSRLSLSGDGGATLQARATTFEQGSTGPLTASLRAQDLAWTQGADIASQVEVSLNAAELAAQDLRLDRAVITARGRVTQNNGLTAALQGDIAAQGRWAGLGPVGAGDLEAIAAVKRLAGGFELSARDLRLDVGAEGPRLSLGNTGALVRGAKGGAMRLTAPQGRPIYGDGQGALHLTLAGDGLPETRLEVERYSLQRDGLQAVARLILATDLGPLQGLKVDTSGGLNISSGRLTYRAQGCAPVSIARLEAGDNSVLDAEGRLCPGPAPTFTFADGAWRLDGRLTDASADVPFLQARASRLAGGLSVGAGRQGLDLQLSGLTAQVADASESPRFNPIDLSGQARLAADQWRADLQLLQDQAPLGVVALRHDGATGAGGVAIDTGRLTFDEFGRQPEDLSPLAEAIGSPATGAAQFQGRFDWTGEGVSSGGRLDVFDLTFKSPAGEVRGLAGTVQFDSLTPLVSAPNQRLTAMSVQSLAPLASPKLEFELDAQGLKILGGAFTLGDGTVRLEPTTIPLDRTQAWRGELVFEGVELSDIVEASPFGDRVDLSAKVSGRLPFIASPEGVRFVEGRLAADGPGRLSIRRNAITQVDATGGAARTEGAGAAVEQTNTAVEFAYQAMENLAFDLLDAEVNSLPGGRLGVLFHVRGRHAPPQRQEIRLTLGELIRRDFLNRELPLPSGTEVDLTLDTSLNLEQLLADYSRARGETGSAPVQPEQPD